MPPLQYSDQIHTRIKGAEEIVQTYVMASVFIQHFESGGTFLDLDPEAVREHFMREFEEGKTLAADLKASATDYQRRQEGDQE